MFSKLFPKSPRFYNNVIRVKSSTRIRYSSFTTNTFKTIPIPVKYVNHSYYHGSTFNDEYNQELQHQMINEAQMDLSRIIKPFHDEQHPVLVRNFYDNMNITGFRSYEIPCRALQNWSDLKYLENMIGSNTLCFVEVGGSYNSSDISRSEIPFGDYLSYIQLFHEKYGSTADDNDENENCDNNPKKEEIVYMAQNDINSFQQSASPGLDDNNEESIKNDYITPQLCYDPSHEVGHGNIYNSMLWFGPKFCVSPLHFDPLDNLLMQFVGRKNVILFPNICNKWHYAGVDGQQYNTSPIDIMNPNMDLYPNFMKAPMAMDCILHPGDILFIPQRWWHYVSSIDTAISVNVWWR